MKLLRVIGVIFMALFVANFIAACAGTKAAYKEADGLFETAFVVGEHYYALIREVNDLDDQGQLSSRDLRTLQEIALQTRPSVLALLDAAEAYQSFESAETEDDLTLALADAAEAIARLINAIDNFGGQTHITQCVKVAGQAQSQRGLDYCLSFVTS